MRIKIKKFVSFQSLVMWVGLLCVVSYALLEHMSISITEFSAVKMPLLYVGGICVIPLLKTFFANILKRRYFFVFLVLFALCAFLLFSMEYNRNTVSGFSPEYNTNRLILYLLELFVLMMVFAEKGKSQEAIRFVYRYVLLLVVLSDIIMFTKLFVFGTKAFPNYLIGTKFTISYMHLNLLVFWSIRQGERRRDNSVRKWFFWVAAVAVALIAVYVDCMTGVLGTAFLVWLMVRRSGTRKQSKLLTTPVFLLISIFLCTLFAFVVGFFLDIPVITSFIEDVLGRDTTLTGRMNIYHEYGSAMEGHWLWGYGYGSGNTVSMQYFACANAQNAVLHWILQCGLVCTSFLIMLFMLIMKQVNAGYKKHKGTIDLLVALVYTYLVLGTVEITYSMSFILFMALLFMVVNDEKRDGQANKALRA